MQQPFDYDAAFSRNIGRVTETEQALLRTKRPIIQLAARPVGGGGNGIHFKTVLSNYFHSRAIV